MATRTGTKLHEEPPVTSDKVPCKLARAVDGEEITAKDTSAVAAARGTTGGPDSATSAPNAGSSSNSRMRLTDWRRWAVFLVPAAGLLELGAHLVQIHSVVPNKDWESARAFVASQAKPDDLIVFAPKWTDPIGRELFGSALATVEREARADETRFTHAYEVAIRGAHLPVFALWIRSEQRRFGAVTVTTWSNPTPVTILADLVSRVDPAHLRVVRAEGPREEDCPFAHAVPQSGELGFGTALPADRFVCPGGSFAASSIVEDTEYRPHRCVYAPPPGGHATLRLRFLDMPMGRILHGHHALYVEAEHANKSPVTITFSAGGSVLGSVVHRDLEGWKPFELDTSALAGSHVDLVAEIECPTSERRMYCFEADTR